MPRTLLSDESWSFLIPFFDSEKKKRGRPPKDRRLLLESALWILRTGSPWRDLPSEFGPWQTAYHHFREWEKTGVIERAFEALREFSGIDDELWSIDGTNVRAHRCAAGAGKKGGLASQKITPLAALAEALERKRDS